MSYTNRKDFAVVVDGVVHPPAKADPDPPARASKKKADESADEAEEATS